MERSRSAVAEFASIGLASPQRSGSPLGIAIRPTSSTSRISTAGSITQRTSCAKRPATNSQRYDATENGSVFRSPKPVRVFFGQPRSTIICVSRRGFGSDASGRRRSADRAADSGQVQHSREPLDDLIPSRRGLFPPRDSAKSRWIDPTNGRDLEVDRPDRRSPSYLREDRVRRRAAATRPHADRGHNIDQRQAGRPAGDRTIE